MSEFIYLGIHKYKILSIFSLLQPQVTSTYTYYKDFRPNRNKLACIHCFTRICRCTSKKNLHFAVKVKLELGRLEVSNLPTWKWILFHANLVLLLQALLTMTNQMESMIPGSSFHSSYIIWLYCLGKETYSNCDWI